MEHGYKKDDNGHGSPGKRQIDVEQDIQIPGPDLSFLQEKKPAKRKHHSALRRLSTIAACMLLLFATSSGMAVWISSDAAHAVKFSLEKTFHRISGTFFSTDDGSETSVEENQISITVDSMDDIEDAVSFMPDLPVPEYIPEGFDLSWLKIVKFMDESYWVEYYFKNSDNISFTITSNDQSNADISVDIIGETEELVLNDKIIYFVEDFYTSTCNATFFLGEQLITVVGDLNETDIILVARNINFNNL